MSRKMLLIVIVLVLLVTLLPLRSLAIKHPTAHSIEGDPGAWSPIDTSDFDVKLVGEDVGRLEGQQFAGWYTDSVVVDRRTGTIIVAWARMNADRYGNDYIYLEFNIPVDADQDGTPEAYQKILKKAGRESSLKSLDSLSIGVVDNKIYVLVTWTYYHPTDKNNVAGALFSVNGTLVWSGDLKGTSAYEEYSKSCFLPAFNNGKGGFLIAWYTSSDGSIDGQWLFLDNGEWRVSDVINIADTNGLYYKKADQMVCVGGEEKVLLVYRVWDDDEARPDLYAALITDTSSITTVKLYDYDGAEETVGVNAAYLNGVFLVPIVSGSYLRYDVVMESDGSVIHKDYVGRGSEPYVIAGKDRFVLAWINHYNDDDGEPMVANIDLDNYDIHPHYGVSVTGGDTMIDHHPIIAYNGTDLLYIWTSGENDKNYDIKIVAINLGAPDSDPTVGTIKTLISWPGNQTANGLGVAVANEYIVAFGDWSDGEKDLLGYYTAPDTDRLRSRTTYWLPRDSDNYKQAILNMIDSAQSSIHIAVAFWDEGESPCSTPGTIAHELVTVKQENPSLDIRVIMDDSTGNDPVRSCLLENGISVVDDSSLGDPSHIMHDKFMVVDGEELIVATVNFIVSDFYKNNNTALYLKSKAVAYFYEEEFEHMWNNGNGLFGPDKTEDHSFTAFLYDPKYEGNYILVVEGYFQPERYGDPGRTPNTIAGYINRAASAVYFSSYIFTTSGWVTPVYNAIVNAHSRGLDVKGVMDELYNTDTEGRRLYWFIDAGVPIALSNHKYKVHAKLFVVDNETAILGSWNPTGSATWSNDEDIIVIRGEGNEAVESLARYILAMYNDGEHFVTSPHIYNPQHPVVTKVMFYPDESGEPDYEWVEITNPTGEDISLAYYVIGDAEDLINGDNEGLYTFPDDAVLPAGSSIVVAYRGDAYYQEYGKYPDYEIIDTVASVPDLTPYNTSKYTGTWNLDDNGDEVILGKAHYGFIVVVDAVWYGNSPYMNTSLGRPVSAEPLNTSNIAPGEIIVDKYLQGDSQGIDALRMNDKYEITEQPQPVPENPLIVELAVIAVILTVIVLTARKPGPLR